MDHAAASVTTGLGATDILALYRLRGVLAYEGEGVTQLQHGWQCGRLARLADATPALQLAAWLHDLGHLMTGWEGSPTVRGLDDAHESLAARVLTPLFGPAVGEPVALHVAAKRCLVGSQPGYRETLSPDSVRSLALQGGPMSTSECEAFLARPHAREALRLRVWDDRAKEPGLQPPGGEGALEELATLMHQVLAAGFAPGSPPETHSP